MESEVIRELADWIDTYVLAENILEELEEAGKEPTLENGKIAWLSFLGNELHHALVRSVVRSV